MIMIADFSAEELEGTKAAWEDRFDNASQNGTNLGAQYYEQFDFGIKAFTVLACMIGPVFFLNAYVGLLSNVYNKIRHEISEHFGNFRLATLLPFLLRRRFR